MDEIENIRNGMDDVIRKIIFQTKEFEDRFKKIEDRIKSLEKKEELA